MLHIREPESLRQRLGRTALQTLEKGLDAGDHTHRGEVFIHFDVQIGLFSHLLSEQIGQHRVRPAAVIGQVDGVQVGMVRRQLRPGQDVLSKGPVEIGMIR